MKIASNVEKEEMTTLAVGPNTYRTVLQFKDFWAYVSKLSLKKEDISRLSPENREKLFFRWKWGSRGNENNMDAEQAHQQMLKMLVGDESDDAKLKRKFNEYCLKIRAELGLFGQQKMAWEQ